jgi:hypothetical protein
MSTAQMSTAVLVIARRNCIEALTDSDPKIQAVARERLAQIEATLATRKG